MPKSDLYIKSTFISTRNKIEDRELICGKVEKRMSPDIFLFYIIEVPSLDHSHKVTSKIEDTLANYIRTNESINTNDFENVLISVNQSLSQLTKIGENKWLSKLNAIIGLSYKSEISISTTGNIKGYIFRKGKISTITECQPNIENHPLKTFTEITSGRFLKDDLLVFGNKDFFDFVSIDKLKILTKDENLTKETAAIAKFLRKIDGKSANAIIIKTTDHITYHEQNSSEEIFFTDDPEETFLTTIIMKISPFTIKASAFVKSYFQKSRTIAKKIFLSTKKSLDEKVAPKTKELLKKGSENIKQAAINSINSAKPQLDKLKESEEFKKLKIKTFSYHKDDNSFGFFQKIKPFIYNLRYLGQKENRKYLYILAIIIFLSIGYVKIKANNDRRSSNIKQLEVSNYLTKATDKFNKTKEDLALGKTSNLDGYYESLSLAEKAQDTNDKDKATALIKTIKEILDEKTKTVRFFNPVSAVLSEKITKIALSGSQIYGFDPSGKLFLVDMRDRESKLIASLNVEFGQPEQIYYSDSMSKILISTSNSKMLSFDQESKVFTEIKLSDSSLSWEKPTSIATYSTNIYLLYPNTNQVLKHLSSDNMYSKGTSYVDTKKISLKNSTDMAIDGNLFILFNDGTVKKFVRGSVEPDFALKGIPTPDDKIIEPTKIFTDESTNSLFVLDKKTNRILKFDKSGDFINQYIFDNISIDDFAVNAKLQKIWGLSNGKVYEGNL